MTDGPSHPAAKPTPASQRLARWKLLGMALLLSLPVAIAYWAFSVLRPQGHLTYGALIQPARPLVDALAQDASGKPVALSSLKGQWLMVSVRGGSCDAACQQRLFLAGQFRETLGKDKDRVDLVWLVNDNAAFADSVQTRPQGTWVLRVAPEVVQHWLGVSPGGDPGEDLYVVDPLGNAMARFPAQFDGAGAKQMRRVWERLLRASVAWDPPGR